MARTSTPSTFSVASAALAGTAVQNEWRDKLDAHAAWSIADEFDSSGPTLHWVVMKCAAVNSGLPSDFYIVICRTISSGVLTLFMCETYNSGTKVCGKLGQIGSAQPTTDANGYQTATFTLATTVPTGANSGAMVTGLAPATATRTLTIADDDHCVLTFINGSNYYNHYMGAIETLVESPISDPMPLAAMMFGSSSSGTVLCHPGCNAVSIPYFAQLYTISAVDVAEVYGRTYGVSYNSGNFAVSTPVAGAGDKWKGGKVSFSRVIAKMQGAFAATSYNTSTMGCIRGRFKKLYACTGLPPGSQMHDTIRIDGKDCYMSIPAPSPAYPSTFFIAIEP